MPDTPRDLQYMERALQLAAYAGEMGEVPIGAVVVAGGQILGEGCNLREMWNDPTAHAEMVALRQAAQAVGGWRLSGTTLYVTLEPCAMCVGAAVLARVERVVFGAPDPKAGACGSVLQVADAPLNHRLKVEGGVLRESCSDLLKRFFRELRARERPQAGHSSVLSFDDPPRRDV
ncbi:tRNA adenosine(34) deaminase TadA [Kyrpidia spormannii]|nr:tRNA adenosine(34) deaminase TadA [Kyrpidia spormannii]